MITVLRLKSESKLSHELVIEAANNTQHLIGQWDSRLEFGRTNLLERYRKERLGVHLHFRCITGRQRHISEFCAAFHYPLATLEIDEIDRARSEIDFSLTGVDGAGGDNFMLVGIVKFMEHPKGMVVWGTGLKWLGLLNDCFGSGRDALYHGGRAGFVFLRFLVDRKLPVTLGCLIRQNEHDMVETGAQLVCDFSSKQAERERWVAEAIINKKEMQSAEFYVWLGPQGISTSLKGIGIDCEMLDVLYGPFNLCFNSV